MNDPYSLLEISRDADPEVIKQAYRRLAKKHHPDRNLGDPRAERHFKNITQAYNLLSDQKARRDYDRGRIDAGGQKRRPPFGQSGFQDHDNRWWSQGVETIVERVKGKFGLNGADRRQADAEPPYDRSWKAAYERHNSGEKEKRQQHRLDIDFQTAVLGGKQRVILDGGKAFDIEIPPGTEDKALLRIRRRASSKSKGEGSGKPHVGGSDDLLISIHVHDHPLFTRRGQDLYLDLPISLREALRGARIRTPTIEGAVWLNIPAKTNSGQLLRLKGKGAADRDGTRGDQYVRLMVTLPKEPTSAMAADLDRLAEHGDYDVRAHLSNR